MELYYKRRWLSKSAIYIAVGILSILFFIVIYGVRVLNPTYTDWLLAEGDLSQHYLGWKAYRAGTWTFPIGLTEVLAYPNKTSIIFTDSIPLFAVIFKVLSPILPSEFQYFGLWGIMCFILQGIFSCKIIKKYTNNFWIIILGSLLVVAAPVMLFRMYMHTSLAGQWLLLYAYDLVFAYETYKQNKTKLYSTIAYISFLAASIHMYFVLMCGIIIVSFCVEDVYSRKSLKRSIFVVCEYCVTSLMIIGLLGGFSSNGAAYSLGGLGQFSMNLNALFNPQGWSVIFKDLPMYVAEQYEGFGYLGAGAICLLLVAVVVALGEEGFFQKVKENKDKFIAILALIVLIIFVAGSPILSIGNIKIYELKLPGIITKIWGLFRASGRIVMVIDYAIVLSSVCVICRLSLFKGKQKKVIAILLVCLSIQIYDAHRIIMQRQARFWPQTTYEFPLGRQELWNAVGENESIEHVIVTYWLGENNYYEIGSWALKYGMTLNSFAMAHPNTTELLNNVSQFLEEPSSNQIFIFGKPNKLTLPSYSLNYYDAGKFILGYVGEFDGFEKMNVGDFSYDEWLFENGQYLTNGEDTESGRRIHSGGLSFGPYWTVPSGKWLITVYGNELSRRTSIEICGNVGEMHYKYEPVGEYSDRLELLLLLDNQVNDLEIAVANISEEDVILNKLRIQEIK